MTELKLAKLPDRTPVKMTITLSPGLKMQLDSYTSLYNQQFSATETVSELTPYLLESFLRSDRGFMKASKGEEIKVRAK